jgi:hypothetical protein
MDKDQVEESGKDVHVCGLSRKSFQRFLENSKLNNKLNNQLLRYYLVEQDV